ncbi:MAG: hypothetical protein IJZ19_15055 [Lentisphaeria bacterium]|nr:hypothetical protein [Lentisphaeria bacterium]
MMFERNRTPLAGIDWKHGAQVLSSTHMHCYLPEHLELYLKGGLECAMVSNYYPSAPWYPLNSIRENTFRLGQTGCFRNGEFHRERIDFTPLLESWKHLLPEESRKQLPFDEGKVVFPDLPENLLEIPNAEHHWFSDCDDYFHVTSPGAMLVTGIFDRFGKFGMTEQGGFARGFPVPWREAFREILDSLLIPDGGGIIINHPMWSHMTADFLLELLDFDPRVLGMEIFNGDGLMDFTAFNDMLWDQVLATGRQCFGFFAQDHVDDNIWQGKIMLLPEERTAEGCMKALRQGRFYGMISDNGLRFEELSFDGRSYKARCNRKVNFQLLGAEGVVADFRGTEFSFDVPAGKREEWLYLRLTALERGAEKLYTQATFLI